MQNIRLRNPVTAIAGIGLAGLSLVFGDALPSINLLENDRISIFAEKPGERAYAERFAETVYEAAFETTGESAGKGLIIIGNYEDPHPIILIKKYLEFAEEGDREKYGAFVNALLDKAPVKWEEADEKLEEEIGLDVESIAYVVPMPLQPGLLNLYLVAREEGFEEEAIERRYRTIKPLDLNFGDFAQYDWVIYLPPNDAIDRAIKDVLPHVMKREKLGFFKRTLVKGAVFTFKPLIRDAMEGVRKSLLYEAILRATSDFDEEEIEQLMEAYRDALMPKGKIVGGNKSKRSLEAIREQLEENEAYALDPYVPPVETISEAPERAVRYEGEYADSKGRTFTVFQEGGWLQFRRSDQDPVSLNRVSEDLYTTEGREMTLEFLADGDGFFSKMELRRKRWRETISRK
jgi:hypothetical protein